MMIDVWNTLESAFDTIIGHLRTAEKGVSEHPIQAVDGWSYLMDFLLFEQQAINGEIVCENLQRRAYTSPKALNNNYRNLVEAGYANEANGLFTITTAAREEYLEYFAQKAEAYSKITVLPDDDFSSFINFLKKGYEAGKIATKPVHKPSMVLGKAFYSNSGGGQLGTMLGWINLFELYRDDVHASVWKKAGFTGIQIETLTQIWRDVAHDIEGLAEDLAFRGYTVDDYQVALDDLVSKGYLAISDNKYALTEQGLTLRKQIEVDTDQLFDDFCAETFSDQEFADFERVIKLIKY